MHENRVCHRDLKPANIMITESKKIVIIDFNVSKHVPKEDSPNFTSKNASEEESKGGIEGYMMGFGGVIGET